MKKKIMVIGAIFCMLMLTQMASAETVNTETKTFIWMRGFIKDLVVENNTITAYAIRLRFISFDNVLGLEGETAFGSILFKQFAVSDVFIKVPLGPLTYMFGFGQTEIIVVE